MIKQQRLEREKLEAISEGVFAWLNTAVPISGVQALEDGARQGVGNWLDENYDDVVEAIVEKVANRDCPSIEGGQSKNKSMTKGEKLKLVRALSVAYELAYRRGFMHGFVSLEENRDMTLKDIADWRFSDVKVRESLPPGRGGRGLKILQRMIHEARQYGDIIEKFLNADPKIPWDCEDTQDSQ